MRTRRRSVPGRARRLVSAGLVVVLLGACGGGGDEEEGATPTTAGAATTQPVGSPSVRIEYLDYAYSVSGPLTAGGTLQLRNSGKEFHMMGIGRFKAGKTMNDVRDALSRMGGPGGPGGGGGEQGGGPTTTSGRPTTTTTRTGGTTTTSAGQPGGGGEEGEGDPLDEVLEELGLPGNVMGPGHSVDLTVPGLSPGNYALVCFIPTEGEGTPHVAKGMIGELRVVEGAAPPPPTADATYKVAPGRAVEGPSSLKAGRHTIRFEAAPGSDQLEPGVGKLNPGRTFVELDQALDRAFESESGPPRNLAGQLPGQLVFGGFDLRGTTTFYLALDLSPGSYVVLSDDSDQKEEPRTRPPQEIIHVSVT